MSKLLVTKEGFHSMQTELKKLKGIDLREAAQMMMEARDKGDISENAEFDSAKENIDNLNKKIIELEQKIAKCIIISSDNVDNSSVQLLTRVRVFNQKIKKEQTFSIVPENEVNIKEGKISFNSPIGKGLIGKIVGDIATIDVPIGKMDLEILDINVIN
jgi:transcription elongation factor GreA